MIDLDRPARYLLPGELVLTNGLWAERVDGATGPARWPPPARRPSASASSTPPRLPDGLVAACEALGLPLLEVPEDLPFSLIAAAAAGGDPSGLRLQLSRTRRLLQRLGGGGGHVALLDFVCHETGLPAWLVGPGGRAVCDGRARARARAGPPAARAAYRGELPAAISDGACAFGAAPPWPAPPCSSARR